MPHNHVWQSRIKAVEREYVAMRQAADRFRQAAFDDPTILHGNLRHGEIIAASQHLEGTYVILVHERADKPKALPISAARGHLCHFFSFLPQQW